VSGASSASAWWQLLRAGNVFTAISNILAGFLLARGDWQPWLPLVFLILSSVCLYLAGMVLNDVFDLEIDRVERPERPLPSGRIEPGIAKLVGWGLMFDGLSAAGIAAWLLASWLPIAVGLMLAISIVAYDAWLKATKLGPVAMGLCRFFNVMLGASAAIPSDENISWFAYAVGIGIYTIGLTLLARNEAGQSRLGDLRLASIIVLLGSSLTSNALVIKYLRGWSVPHTALLLSTLALVYFPLQNSMRLRTPAAVQASVSRLITLFIVLDAAACWAAGGWTAGLVVLSLLIPTYIATRRTSMT